MASVNPTQYDGWWVELGTYFRTTDVRIYKPEQVQIDNMNLVYDYFIARGWTANAIAGMLGNMMVESSVNPWLFEHRSLDWSNPSAILSDSGGMGLTQWTPCRKYYQWALDENLDPQSGYSMCARIKYEETNHLQWSTHNILNYTWSDYVSSTRSPEILARVFLWAYERPYSPDVSQRQSNARWCYDNIRGTGFAPYIVLLLSRNSQRKELKRPCRRI